MIREILTCLESAGMKARIFFLRVYYWIFSGQRTKFWAKAGIVPNGPNPWDPQIRKGSLSEFNARVVGQGTLGLGETYMDGVWEVEDLEEFIFRLAKNRIYQSFLDPVLKFGIYFVYKMFNLQTKELAAKNTKMHYEAQNQVILSMIGPSLNYTCGDWRQARNLEDAQFNKMELVAQKLKLKPGMRVLDIGCGWGSMAKHLAERYGVRVVAVTICKESVKFAKNLCQGLPVEIYLMDYRDVHANCGEFDRVVSLGMFEHVGIANYRTYFETVNKLLVDGGIFVMQTIATTLEGDPQVDTFSNKYIFGAGMTPYASEIIKHSKGALTIEDWHFWGINYHPTLIAWYNNFVAAWPDLKGNVGRDERFFRMWKMYLLLAAGLFRSRALTNYQIVFSKLGSLNPYLSVR